MSVAQQYMNKIHITLKSSYVDFAIIDSVFFAIFIMFVVFCVLCSLDL